MKIKIEFEFDDFLEEKDIYDDEGSYVDTYYEVKDNATIKEEIKNEIVRRIADDIRYDIRFGTGILKQARDTILKEYKDKLIEEIIDKVSKSIINGKRIKDFKKEIGA